MRASANVARKWKPRLEDIDEISRACCRSNPPTIEDYAKKVGAPAAELLAWIGKITAALNHRPGALACIRHLADLRKAGRQPPCVQPRDVRRRADALQRADALAAILPVWPNPPLPPPPDHNPQLDNPRGSRRLGPRERGPSGWTRDSDGVAHRVSHGPHKRRQRDDDDDDCD